MNPALALLGGAAALGFVMLPSRRKRKASQRPLPPAPSPLPFPSPAPTYDLRSLYTEVPFPPVDALPERSRLLDLARAAEVASGIEGLTEYLLAVAYRESKFVPSALGDIGQGANFLCRYDFVRARFRNAGNPWAPDLSSQDACLLDPRRKRWDHSGGWFGLLPATALSQDPLGHAMDPARIFDPAFAVAFAAALVHSLYTRYDARIWSDVRAGWKRPALAKTSLVHPDKQALLQRFDSDLRDLEALGLERSFKDRAVHVQAWPGFLPVLRATLRADGRPLLPQPSQEASA